MGFGGFGSLGFGRVWVIGWAVGVWGGGRLNGHEKKMGLKKIMGVKIQGNSLYFFPIKIGQKTREFLLLFFAKYTRFVRNFLKNLFLVFFSNFFTTDTLKSLLGGPIIIGEIY